MRTLIAATLLVFGLANAVPALAQGQAETSLCGVDKLPRTERAAALAAMQSDDQDVLFALVERVISACRSKVTVKAAQTPEFREFVLFDTMTFLQRDLLISRGFKMDAFDRRVDMRCNSAMFLQKGDLPEDSAKLILKALEDSGTPVGTLTQPQLVDTMVYVISLARYWQAGQDLEILPACRAAA